jgi:lysophospholipase L1-like esterase
MPTGAYVYVKDLEAFTLGRKVADEMVLIGDSYLGGVRAAEGHGWGYYLQQALGNTAYTFANHGGGFLRGGNANSRWPGKNFAQVVEIAAGEVPDASKIGAVVIAGGWNDHGADLNQIYTQALAAIRNAYRVFPNAVVYVVPLSNWRTDLGSYSNVNYQINQAAMDAGAPCPAYSWLWLVGRRETEYSGDTVHPNETGYRYQGYAIAAFMRGGDPIPDARMGLGYGTGDGSTNVIRCGIQGGMAFLEGSVTGTGWSNNFLVGTLPYVLTPTIGDGTHNPIYIPCHIYGGSGENAVNDITTLHIYPGGAMYCTTPKIRKSWPAASTELTLYIPPVSWPVGRA